MSILRSINEGFERRYGKLIDDRKQKEVKECDGECKGKKAEKEPIAKDYGARVAESRKKGVKECDEKSRKGAIVRRPAMKEACRKDRKSIKEYKDMGQDLGEYQKWVDYDMKRYHKISDKTMDKIKKAGLTVVKDQYGDYEVIAHEPVRECDDKEAKRRAVVKEAMNESFGTKVAKWYDDKYEYFIQRKKDEYDKYNFTIGKDSDWREDFDYYMKDFNDILDKYDPSSSEEIDKVVDSMSREDKEKLASRYGLTLNESFGTKVAKRKAVVKEAVERVRARKLQEAKQAEEKRKAVIKESVERVKARRLQESKKRK